MITFQKISDLRPKKFYNIGPRTDRLSLDNFYFFPDHPELNAQVPAEVSPGENDIKTFFSPSPTK